MRTNKQLDEFMEHHRWIGLTYDDVSLLTDYAEFLPSETDIRARLTRGITLNIPFVSAAMDSVTQAEMGIAMALAGGIGIVHKNLDPAAQRTEVKRIKYYLNGFLAKARWVTPEMTVADVEKQKQERGYQFHSYPVLDEQRRLLGIITGSQFRYATPEMKVADIMVKNTVSAPEGTTIKQAYEMLMKHRISILPVVNAEGIFKGLYTYKDVVRIIHREAPLQCVDERYSLRAGAAVGPMDHERVECLLETIVDVIVVDCAHGHTKNVRDMIYFIKRLMPYQQVIAGNVATAEGARALADAGADGVKVGVGPGSICTTRVVAGVGVPQLTAVYECARELRSTGVPVIADGGIRFSGDVAKSIAAGASTVMMGNALAGTDEAPGERVLVSGRQYVGYRGMGSLGALAQRNNSADRYGQKEAAKSGKFVPEGIEGLVPSRGPAGRVLDQFCGGLRASLGYTGCRSLDELQLRGRFIRISEASKKEAHPHDVEFIKDSPNYHGERG